MDKRCFKAWGLLCPNESFDTDTLKRKGALFTRRRLKEELDPYKNRQENVPFSTWNWASCDLRALTVKKAIPIGASYHFPDLFKYCRRMKLFLIFIEHKKNKLEYHRQGNSARKRIQWPKKLKMKRTFGSLPQSVSKLPLSRTHLFAKSIKLIRRYQIKGITDIRTNWKETLKHCLQNSNIRLWQKKQI